MSRVSSTYIPRSDQKTIREKHSIGACRIYWVLNNMVTELSRLAMVLFKKELFRMEERKMRVQLIKLYPPCSEPVKSLLGQIGNLIKETKSVVWVNFNGYVGWFRREELQRITT